jgi:hypothetical protein
MLIDTGVPARLLAGGIHFGNDHDDTERQDR